MDEIISVLERTVDKHPGVKLTIDISLPPIPLDADVEGFKTIVVSYFTVTPFSLSVFTVKDVPHLYGDFKRYLYGPGRYFRLFDDLSLVFTQLTHLTSLSKKRTYWKLLRDIRN